MTPEHGLNCLLGDHDLNWIINGYWTNKIDKFISIFISLCLFSKSVWHCWIKHVTPAFQKQFHMQIKVRRWTKFTSYQSGKSIARKFSINVACVNSTCSISLMSIRRQGHVLESNKFHGREWWDTSVYFKSVSPSYHRSLLYKILTQIFTPGNKQRQDGLALCNFVICKAMAVLISLQCHTGLYVAHAKPTAVCGMTRVTAVAPLQYNIPLQVCETELPFCVLSHLVVVVYHVTVRQCIGAGDRCLIKMQHSDTQDFI